MGWIFTKIARKSREYLCHLDQFSDQLALCMCAILWLSFSPSVFVWRRMDVGRINLSLSPTNSRISSFLIPQLIQIKKYLLFHCLIFVYQIVRIIVRFNYDFSNKKFHFFSLILFSTIDIR